MRRVFLSLVALLPLLSLDARAQPFGGEIRRPEPSTAEGTVPVVDSPVPLLVPGPDGVLRSSSPAVAPAPRPDPFLRTALPTIGVLLPLTGEYASFGDSCLKGIRLALEQEGGYSAAAFRISVIDTYGSGAQAAVGFQRLAADPSTVAVLGPMLKWELEGVRPYVARNELLTVSFSQQAVPAGGPVVRFSMTRDDQARTLAEFAVVERGIRRWAILHPQDTYGRELAFFFRSEVERLGGSVPAMVGYEQEAQDFRTSVSDLARRLGIATEAGSKEEKGAGPPPIDGIFLPDSAEKVAVLLPYLAFFDIHGVQLLGANGWNRIEVLRKAMPAVNGGIFSDGFFLSSPSPGVREFVDHYRTRYDADPGILEAHGYDAATIVKQQVLRGARNRRLMLDAFRTAGTYVGATGVNRVRTDGAVERSVFLLQIVNGTLREVERSLDPRSTFGAVAGEVSAPPEWRRPEFDSRRGLP